MKFKLSRWLVFTLCLGVGSIHAQSTLEQLSVDSLLHVAGQTKIDSTRQHAYAILALKLLETDHENAEMYARRAVRLADQKGPLSRKIAARRILGDVKLRLGQMDSTKHYARQAINLAEECADRSCREQHLIALKLLREPFRESGNYNEIIKFLRAFRDLPSLDPALHYETRRLLAYPLMVVGDFDAALHELNLVREYGLEVADQNLLCNLYSELITAYYSLKRHDKAIATARERLVVCAKLGKSSATHALHTLAITFDEAGQLDSAYAYYRQVLYRDELSDFNRLYLLGNLLAAAQRLDLPTEEYHRAMLNILEKDNEITYLTPHQKQFLYGTLSRYYLKEEDYTRARRFARTRLEAIQKTQGDTTDLSADALSLLAETQAAAGDYESAWHTFNDFYHHEMTVVQRNQEEALARVSVEMDLAENDRARRLAEEATVLEQRNSSFRTRFLLTLLGSALLLSVVLLWANHRARRDKQLIREQNKLVADSLAEKEVLLREIHHRVKNNLQIISSLLNKQARKSDDAEVRRLVREGQERIQSMALIHQNLYESDHLSGVDIAIYLQELSANIQRSQAVSPERVQLELNVAQEKLEIDTAIPVGLILNELLTNCYKYAFPNTQSGHIRVDFHKVGKEYRLDVSDDGIGFAPEAHTNSKSLGLNLVKGLVRQLEGSIKWLRVAQGTAVAIRF